MPKFSETYSKWKSIGEGLAIVLGASLDPIWTSYSENGIPVADGLLSLSAVWHLLTRWFQDKKTSGKYLCNLGQAGGCGSGV